MTIEWGSFVTVVVSALFSAVLFVTLYSLALRLGDGAASWRRPISIVLFVLCGLVVLFGLFLIVPWQHLFS